MATYLDAAGPSGLPAAVMHPDTPLPLTWRTVSTWEHDGQRGAWLEWHEGDAHWADAHSLSPYAQIVYDEAEPVRRPSSCSQVLTAVASRMRCISHVAWSTYMHRATAVAERRERDAFYAEQGVDIAAHDRLEAMRWHAAGRPEPDAPYSVAPSPAPLPAVNDDKWIAKLGVDDARAHGIDIHPDSPWPSHWERVTIDGDEWALDCSELLDGKVNYAAVFIHPDGKLYGDRGLKQALSAHRRSSWARADKLDPAAVVAAPEPVTPPPPPAGPPPEPGIDRAKWIGERIAAMTARESSEYLPHTRRRIAAHRALSIVQGYTPDDAVNDGLILSGGFLLHLEGLNQYAARAFAGLED